MEIPLICYVLVATDHKYSRGMDLLRILMFVGISFAISGCGSDSSSQVDDCEISHEVSLALTIVDSIGCEMADSDYVFGTIVDAEYFKDGRFTLLDIVHNKISIFTNDGQYLNSFGSEGNGPGEFAEPSSFTLFQNGDIAVSDNMHGKIIYFDSSMSYQKEINGFYNTPHFIACGSDSSIIGMQFDYYRDGSSMYVGRRVCSWNDSTDPNTVFASSYVLANDDIDEFPIFTLDTNFDGFVASARKSLDLYQFICQDCNGDTLFQVSQTIDRIPKTQDELNTEHMEYRFDTPGFSDSDRRAITERWEPNPYRYAINAINIDLMDRVWVMSGIRESSSPLFEVYDISGNHITSVQTDFGPQANNWTFVFGDSTALAFDSNPSDYPKVYLLSISEHMDE